jgi:hypothetical protein
MAYPKLVASQRFATEAIRTYQLDAEGQTTRLHWTSDEQGNIALTRDSNASEDVTAIYNLGSNLELSEPMPEPSTLTKTEFQDYAEAQMGGGTIGAARFGSVIMSARQSMHPNIVSVMERYGAQDVIFRRDVTKALLDTFVSLNIGDLTAQEAQTVYDNWPME